MVTLDADSKLIINPITFFFKLVSCCRGAISNKMLTYTKKRSSASYELLEGIVLNFLSQTNWRHFIITSWCVGIQIRFTECFWSHILIRSAAYKSNKVFSFDWHLKWNKIHTKEGFNEPIKKNQHRYEIICSIHAYFPEKYSIEAWVSIALPHL